MRFGFEYVESALAAQGRKIVVMQAEELNDGIVRAPAGAHASAVIYSLVQTAKANGLEPYTWLRRVLRNLPAANSIEAVEALLPWNLHTTDLMNKTAQ